MHTTQSLKRSAILPEKAFLMPADQSGTQIVEIKEFLSIGRDPTCDLELANPFVSSRHARVEKKEQGYLIRDLRSQNGTWLNGSRIMEAYLSDGDRLKLGDREFTFQTSAATQLDSSLTSRNEAWAAQLQSLPSFSRTDLPVLLLGASGTGKEILARMTHEHSLRASGPFVSVNCSALNPQLIESELFGHVKGSYTGATHDRKGAFESARTGTLFLDEIGDLPIDLQPKLLRALENREIRPVGSDKSVITDVRIIAATHKNLQTQVIRGAFRQDLFFRLHVIRIHIPSLKDRMEDFESLLYSFAREMRVRFSYGAIQALKMHSWPGNIRELKNVVARASALFPQTQVEACHVDCLLDHYESEDTVTLKSLDRSSLREAEREMIVQKLVQHKGNQRKVAAALGMPKSTLHDRLKQYEIDITALLNGEPCLPVVP